MKFPKKRISEPGGIETIEFASVWEKYSDLCKSERSGPELARNDSHFDDRIAAVIMRSLPRWMRDRTRRRINLSIYYMTMKRKWLNRPILIGMMCCAIALGSCGGDDKENEGPETPENQDPPETPGTDLPEKSAVFVGYWRGSRVEARAFLFRTDGSGRMQTHESFVPGDWSFDPETSILSTTMSSSSRDNWQFKVTTLTDNAWTGVYALGGERSYWRGSNLDYARLLLPLSSWETGSLNLKIGRNAWSGDDSLSGSILDPERENFKPFGPDRIGVYEDDDPNDFVFKYELSVSPYTLPLADALGSGTVKIDHPYDPSRTTITFTGTLKGTMKLKGWGWGAYLEQ